MPLTNEIQTITLPNFVGATGFAYFSCEWPNYLSDNSALGANADDIDGLSAAAVATMFQTNFNNNVTSSIDPTKTASVTGALNGNSLVLTIEFDGAGIAATNVELGLATDWGDIGEPVFATTQQGGEEPPAATGNGRINLLTMGVG